MADATAKGETTAQELTRAQQVVARRTAESKATIPHLILETEVDMEACVALHGASELSSTPLVVRACALALREHPRANGAYRDGRFEHYDRVNVGVGIDADDALVFPTIFDADRKGLGEIADELAALGERVRQGVATSPELSGATFTVFDLGEWGVTRSAAVVHPSQAAALAVGAVVPRAVVRDGEVVVRHVLALTLACDHRILYGAVAAAFLARVRGLLEDPGGL